MTPTYKFKFSIVTAVHNTAEYIDEMMESLINQDIGFKENVQVILVDDGSSDNSFNICKSYEKRYPNNVKVVFLKHSGVSKARNEGIRLAEGKYINFLDSDDKLDTRTLKIVYNFFKKNYDTIDLVSIPLFFFDAEYGEHILNNKFISNRIINISEEYSSIQLSSSSSFIKKDVLSKYEFSFKLKYAEDALLITQVILEKGRYGVVSDGKYLYRKRKKQISAIQSGYKDSKWYIDYITNFSIVLLDLYKEKNYRSYINSIVLYDLQWRVFPIDNLKLYLTKSQKKEFLDKLLLVLTKIRLIDIYNQKNISKKRKIIFMVLKTYANVRYILY